MYHRVDVYVFIESNLNQMPSLKRLPTIGQIWTIFSSTSTSI